MPNAPVPAHVWTARAQRAPVGRRLGRALRQPGIRVAVAVLVPALVLAPVLGRGGADPAAASDVVAAAAAPGSAGAVGGVRAPGEPRSDDPGLPAGPVRFATVAGVDLFVTSPAASIVGFHEASYDTALGLVPVGRGLAFDNGRPHHVDAAGPNFVVMGTRGRPTSATTAVDIAQPPGTEVVAPVTGTVTDVTPYSLYGRYADTRIEIAPVARPDLRVVVLHVSGATVAPGHSVEAGLTRVAQRATDFPFASHVDAYAGGRPPHVHVEVKRL